jgi:hypothetical protein
MSLHALTEEENRDRAQSGRQGGCRSGQEECERFGHD